MSRRWGICLSPETILIRILYYIVNKLNNVKGILCYRDRRMRDKHNAFWNIVKPHPLTFASFHFLLFFSFPFHFFLLYSSLIFLSLPLIFFQMSHLSSIHFFASFPLLSSLLFSFHFLFTFHSSFLSPFLFFFPSLIFFPILFLSLRFLSLFK